MTNIDFSLFGFYGPSTDPPTFFQNFFLAHTHRVEHSILYKINPWWIFLDEYLGFYTLFSKGTPYFHMKNTDLPWTSLNYIRFFLNYIFIIEHSILYKLSPWWIFLAEYFCLGTYFYKQVFFWKIEKHGPLTDPPTFFRNIFFALSHVIKHIFLYKMNS